MRLLLGAGGWSRNQLVHNARFSRRKQVHHDLGGTTRLLREPDEAETNTRSASFTAGADRRTGRAMRLLLQRTDHQGSRVAVQKSATDGSADPDGHERPLVPMR